MKVSILFVVACFIGAMNAQASARPTRARISLATGAVFTVDDSHPALGIAFRSPTNVVWGDILIYGNTRDAAIAYCGSIGAQLPTVKDYEELVQQLGGHGNYSARSTFAGGLDVLLNLSYNHAWTSSKHEKFDGTMVDSGQAFNGSNGGFFGLDPNAPCNTRCIVKE
jgi:hypothetical protein